MKFSSQMRSHTGTVGLDTQVNWPRWLSLVHIIKLQEEVMLGSHISTGRCYGLEVKYWPRQTLLSGRESASSPAPTHTDSSCSWLTRTLACTHSSHPSLEQIHLAMDFLICKSQSSESIVKLNHEFKIIYSLPTLQNTPVWSNLHIFIKIICEKL